MSSHPQSSDLSDIVESSPAPAPPSSPPPPSPPGSPLSPAPAIRRSSPGYIPYRTGRRGSRTRTRTSAPSRESPSSPIRALERLSSPSRSPSSPGPSGGTTGGTVSRHTDGRHNSLFSDSSSSTPASASDLGAESDSSSSSTSSDATGDTRFRAFQNRYPDSLTPYSSSSSSSSISENETFEVSPSPEVEAQPQPPRGSSQTRDNNHNNIINNSTNDRSDNRINLSAPSTSNAAQQVPRLDSPSSEEDEPPLLARAAQRFIERDSAPPRNRPRPSVMANRSDYSGEAPGSPGPSRAEQVSRSNIGLFRLSPPGVQHPQSASDSRPRARRSSNLRRANDEIPAGNVAPAPADARIRRRARPDVSALTAARRRSIVEVDSDSDSDDDIVFTGENRRPDPPQQQRIQHELPQRIPPPRRRHGLDNNRGPSPDAFHRAMREIDDILEERRDAHDAIVAGQGDARRRLLLSPDPAPAPPQAPRPVIGLGGGGLFRGGERLRNARNQAQAIAQADPNNLAAGAEIDEAEEITRRRAMLMRRLIGHHGLGGTEGLRLGMHMGRERLDMAHPGLGLMMFGNRPIYGALDAQIADLAGPAGRVEDVKTILARVEAFKYDPPPEGYTRDFDMDLVASEGDQEPIMIDDEGNVVEKERKSKAYLVCANCPSPLLVSSAYRSPDDRVWTLRCGHMIDSRCLELVQTPKTAHQLASVDRHLEILGGDGDETNQSPATQGNGRGGKRRNVRRKTRKVEEKKPDEYTWVCPVDGCGKKHVSQDIGASWVGKEGQGAIAVYA